MRYRPWPSEKLGKKRQTYCRLIAVLHARPPAVGTFERMKSTMMRMAPVMMLAMSTLFCAPEWLRKAKLRR